MLIIKRTGPWLRGRLRDPREISLRPASYIITYERASYETGSPPWNAAAAFKATAGIAVKVVSLLFLRSPPRAIVRGSFSRDRPLSGRASDRDISLTYGEHFESWGAASKIPTTITIPVDGR